MSVLAAQTTNTPVSTPMYDGANPQEIIVANIDMEGESSSDPFVIRKNAYYSVELMENVLNRIKCANDFEGRDLRTHIYLTPDSYAGSDKWVPRQEWVLEFGDGNPENFRVKLRQITTPYVIVQAFVEVISNSVDNITDCRMIGIPEHPPERCAIEVTMDRQWITVKNYGQPIPVEIKDYTDMETGIAYQKWAPEYVLTKLLVSSNYDGSKTRHGAGKNGVGAKLMVIFSKQVKIEIIDGFRGKKYTQLVEDNMTVIHPPVLEDIELGTMSSTTISYLLDFERFGVAPSIGYSDMDFAILANRTLGTSFTSKSPTSFNGVQFRYFHIKEYGRLIFGNLVESAMIRYELSDPETEEIRLKNINGVLTPTPVTKPGVPKRVVIPDTEVLLIDSAYSFHDTIVSFVNSVPTIKGGAHVKKLHDTVIPPILQKINDVEPKVVIGKLKGKALRIAAAKKAKAKEAKARSTKKEPPKKALRKDDIRPYVSGIVSCRVHDPSFNSQTKVELAGPEPKLALDQSDIDIMYNWSLMEKLRTHLNAMKMYMMEKANGRKVKNIQMKNGFDAWYAGTAQSSKCVLWIVEGTSALAYAMALLSHIPNGRDYVGMWAIRGKFINVLKSNPEALPKNPEVKMMYKLLGLQQFMKYDVPENFAKLRYGGGVMIMADADKDGSHIKGLLANFFHGLFPELLKVGYLIDYRTKFLTATNGKEKVRFYTEWQLSEWKKTTPNWNTGVWKYEYFKGLGTAEKKDVEEDHKHPKSIQFTYDGEGDAMMFDTIFGKSGANKRKEWMKHIRGFHDREYQLTAKVSFTTFFNREFIGYVIESLDRAIPNASDGLKRCQRQILHAMTTRWKGKGPYTEDKYKVAQFAGHVATKCEYQHNEHCIALATIIMARNFVGSNNIQLLMDRGQFGSRFFGGVDHASPRYIFTNPSTYLYKIFRKEDLSILKHHQDDGVDVEPVAYYPIFPLILANGAQGVATGYSTTVMNYNPIEVTDWVLITLFNTYFAGSEHEKLPLHTLIPWFKGFKGNVMLIRDGGCEDVEFDTELKDPVVEWAEEGGVPEDVIVDDLSTENDIVIPSDIGHDNTVSAEPVLENEPYRFDRVIIEGVFRRRADGKIHITELPIGKWTINYNYHLQELRDMKKIKDFKDDSNTEKIDIVVEGMNNPSHKKLGLIKRVSLSNMVFLDEHQVPVRFRLVEDYLEYFMKMRLEMYEKRIACTVDVMEVKIAKAKQKMAFVEAVKSGQIVLDREDLEVEKDMERMGFPKELLEKVNLRRMVRGKTSEHRIIINKLEKELAEYREWTPAKLWYKELTELRETLAEDPEMIRTKPGLLLTKKGAKKYYPTPAPKELKNVVKVVEELAVDKETPIVLGGE